MSTRPIATLRRFVGRGAQGEGGPYQCRRCGERFRVQYHVCPNCTSYRVERRDW